MNVKLFVTPRIRLLERPSLLFGDSICLYLSTSVLSMYYSALNELKVSMLSPLSVPFCLQDDAVLFEVFESLMLVSFHVNTAVPGSLCGDLTVRHCFVVAGREWLSRSRPDSIFTLISISWDVLLAFIVWLVYFLERFKPPTHPKALLLAACLLFSSLRFWQSQAWKKSQHSEISNLSEAILSVRMSGVPKRDDGLVKP